MATTSTGDYPIVLDEDTWLAAIEEIVGRDFFPDAQSFERPAGSIDVTGISLDEFLHRYTSEDNASFREILDRTNAKRREKVAHLMLPPAARPALAAAAACNQSKQLKKYEAINLLMYDGSTRSSLPLVRVDTGAGAGPSGRPPKGIQHSATSLNMTRAGASGSEIDLDGFDGINSSVLSLRLQPNGGPGDYSLLETPLLRPGKEVTPILTWGGIDATPQRLDDEHNDRIVDDTGRADDDAPKRSEFRMRDTPVREKLAHSLAAKAGVFSSSSRGRHTPGSGTIARTPLGTPSMSPAAHRLAGRVQKSRSSKKYAAKNSIFGDKRPRSSWDDA